MRAYLAAHVIVSGLLLCAVASTHSIGCPNHYHIDVDVSLTMQKVTLSAANKHVNKTTEELGIGLDPNVWLEAAEIAHMPLAQLAELSWLPRNYAGAGQWFHRCRPTCVFMSERRDTSCDARHWVCGEGRVTRNKVIAYKHVIRRADGMKQYMVPSGSPWQQLRAVMDAVNVGPGGLHPSCPDDGMFHHFWRNPPREVSGNSKLRETTYAPYPPGCPVLQLVLWGSMPQSLQGRLLSHLGSIVGVRLLDVRQVRWPQGSWNWAQCHAFFYAARFHNQAKGHVMVPELLPETAARKGRGPFTVAAVAINCSMSAFVQKRREVVGHDPETKVKLPKDKRYELHEERDGFKALKEHLRRKFLLDLPAADSGKKPWYALHMSLNDHEARHDWHAMFGNQNGGEGPRDRYYDWLLEARDNGTTWDGTVQPPPASATCANGSYAFTIPDGRPLNRAERTYVPRHESPGEIAELEGDQKFVPLPRSNRKATAAGEYTLDVHKQLKKEVKARQQRLFELSGLPKVEIGRRNRENRKSRFAGTDMRESDAANRELGSRHRLDWTEDEEETAGGMAVSLTKERAAAILKAKKALDKKNAGNKRFIRHKVVQSSNALKTGSNELEMQPMTAEELAAVKQDLQTGLRKMRSGSAVRIVKGAKGKSNSLAGPKNMKEAIKMLPKSNFTSSGGTGTFSSFSVVSYATEKDTLHHDELTRRLRGNNLGWVVPLEASSLPPFNVHDHRRKRGHERSRGDPGGEIIAIPKKQKQVWA